MIASPYESAYASCFIFALGYVARDEGLELSSTWANSLAQSPDDMTVGDLLLGWKGRTFIFEFKRRPGSIKSELRKSHRVRLLRQLHDPRCAHVRAIVERGHFLACGLPADGCGLRFFPYPLVSQPPPESEWWTLDAFIRTVLFSSSYGFHPDNLAIYLNELKKFSTMSTQSSASGSGSASTASMAALVVNYDKDTRQLRFLQVDLLDRDKLLDLEPELAREQVLERGAMGPER